MLLDKKLQVFLAVAETGSFSRAARQLSTSQSGVSFHIEKLEQSLGVELFLRRSRGVRLTASGELLLAEATQMAERATKLEATMAEQSSVLASQIQLAGDAITCAYTLPWTIAAFREAHSDGSTLRFRYRHIQGDELVEALAGGALDLALSGQRPHDRRLAYQSCFVDEVILVGSPERAPAEVTVPELAELPLLWPRGDLGLETVVSRALAQAGMPPGRLDVVMEIEAFPMLKTFMRAGLGLAFVPRMTVADELHYGLLKEVPVADLHIERNTYLVFPKARPPRELVANFIEFVRSRDPNAVPAPGAPKPPVD